MDRRVGYDQRTDLPFADNIRKNRMGEVGLSAGCESHEFIDGSGGKSASAQVIVQSGI